MYTNLLNPLETVAYIPPFYRPKPREVKKNGCQISGHNSNARSIT